MGTSRRAAVRPECSCHGEKLLEAPERKQRSASCLKACTANCGFAMGTFEVYPMLTREITVAMLAIEERDPGMTQLKTHGLVCLRETACRISAVYLKTQSAFVIAIGQHLSKKAMCSLICLPFHISESKFQKPGLHALKSPSLSRRLQQVPKRVAKTHSCCQIEIDTETPVCNITMSQATVSVQRLCYEQSP